MKLFIHTSQLRSLCVNQIKKGDQSCEESGQNRRFFLSKLVPFSAGIIATTALKPNEALATIMSNEGENAKIFKSGVPLEKDFAFERFKLARKDLEGLLNDYDNISQGGGDNVRRYLGTVGVTSGMYGITKVLKELQEEADDIVEYTENMNEFDSYLRAADTACYSANFVEFSAAKTKPEKFLEDAKMDSKNMLKAMERMAAELKL